MFAGLLDQGFTQPAACLITTGVEGRSLDALAPLVKSVEVTASRAEAATGQIVFEDRRDEAGRWLAADSGQFSRWRKVSVEADFGVYRERVLSGYVKALRPTYPPNGGDATLEVQLQDESLLLDRTHERRVWGDPAPQTDRSILEAILAPLGLRANPKSGQGQTGRSLNQDGPPIRFLRDRAKASGYELIFDGSDVYFGPPQLDGEPLTPLLIYAGRQTTVLTFLVDDDALKPDAVRFDHPPASEGAQAVSETVQPAARRLGSTPADAEGADLPAPFVWRLSREGDETEDQMRARAQALADENAFKLKASGEIDGSTYGHVLKPGRLVAVDGAGPRYGGLWYVDKVTHLFSAEGYKQGFELLRNATGEEGGAPGPMGAASAIAGLFA